MRLVHLALILSIGCAHGAFRAPREGGPPWVQLDSPHFMLRTDLPEAQARNRIAELELVYAAIRTAWPAQSPGSRIAVVAVRDVREMEEFVREKYDLERGFAYASFFGQPTIVVNGDRSALALPLIRLVVASEAMSANLRREPRWLLGLADMFETLRIDESRAEVVVGEPHPFLGELRKVGPIPADWVLGWSAGSRSHRLYRETSWLLAQVLFTNRTEEFRTYLGLLSAGDEPQRAWNESFGANSIAGLDGELERASQPSGPLTILTFPFRPAIAPPSSISPLPDAELHAMRAEMLQHAPLPFDGGVEGQAEIALRDDPGHPVALAVHPRLKSSERLERVREGLRAHPDDFRRWLLAFVWAYQAESNAVPSTRPIIFTVGRLLQREGKDLTKEMRDALEHAVAAAPDDPDALAAVAQARLVFHDVAGSTAAAQRALLVYPGWPALLDVYAAGLAQGGRCDEARRALQIARGNASDWEIAQGPIFYGRVFSTGQADLRDRLEAHATELAARCPRR